MEPHDPDPSLINDDIRPVALGERHWTVLSMASLWVGMVVCVPTYMLAGGLIDQGMSWSQAVLTILLGNVIVLAPMILNGHPGTKYGVPFPVLARASFGINGAHVPSLLRALVACGWFGIQTWVGGAAIYALLDVVLSSDLTALAARDEVQPLHAEFLVHVEVEPDPKRIAAPFNHRAARADLAEHQFGRRHHHMLMGAAVAVVDPEGPVDQQHVEPEKAERDLDRWVGQAPFVRFEPV